MTDDGQNRDDANKTLMFDPAQTEAFKKMARLARQQSEQGPAQRPTAPAMSAVPGGPGPQLPHASFPVDEASANKTMMLGAAELAQMRAAAAPQPKAPVRPVAPETIAIDPTKTLPLNESTADPISTNASGVPSALDALSSGLDAAIAKSRTPTPPLGVDPSRQEVVGGGTQMFSPGGLGMPMGGGETVAYSPEQVARLRAQSKQAPEAAGGGQTMLYDSNQSAELKEAFDLLKRHQAMEAERSSTARAEAEALLRGIGDEPVQAPAPTPVPAVAYGTPAPAATQQQAAMPAASAPSSPLNSPLELLNAPRQQLPLTGAPAQPRAAVRGGTARFETGTPRKGKAGTVVIVILLVAVGAALVAGALHYAGYVEIPFLPKF